MGITRPDCDADRLAPPSLALANASSKSNPYSVFPSRPSSWYARSQLSELTRIDPSSRTSFACSVGACATTTFDSTNVSSALSPRAHANVGASESTSHAYARASRPVRTHSSASPSLISTTTSAGALKSCKSTANSGA